MASLNFFAFLLKFAISKIIFIDGSFILLNLVLIKSRATSTFFCFEIICAFFFNLNQSISETISNIKIEDLKDLPSTYEEIEEFVEEDNDEQQILQQVRYKESQKLNNEIITIEIKALNKITAKTSTLSIKLGEEKYFGNLKIKPLKCKASDIDQPPDTVAYLQVIDTSDKKNDQVFVFNGWTFASSPTLRSLDHSIYDLWLLGCTNT